MLMFGSGMLKIRSCLTKIRFKHYGGQHSKDAYIKFRISISVLFKFRTFIDASWNIYCCGL